MRSSILLVSNDAILCRTLVEALTTTGGFTVCTADAIGMAQALMLAGAEYFDLMLLDVSLPDGDGRAFCASLRRQGFELPVILLSDLSHEDDVVWGFEAGADDYLTKPFGPAELLARIAAQFRHPGIKSEAPASPVSLWVVPMDVGRKEDAYILH